jgi:hypothetical protein
LTLVMVPAGFTLMDDFERWLGRHLLPHFTSKHPAAAVPSAAAAPVAALSPPTAQSNPA